MSTITEDTSAKRTLLIVDDEDDLREIMVTMLRPLTADIRTAANGIEALEIIRAGGVDAILSDITMPKMNGLQLLAEVRHLSLETPFVILTGFADKENMREALRMNVTDFLEKPFDRQTLTDVTKRALDLGLALREVERELSQLFSNSQLPPEKVIRHREMRRSLLMMKAEHSIYFKGKK